MIPIVLLALVFVVLVIIGMTAIAGMASEQIVVSNKANPERSYAEVRGMATITFNGNETNDEITVTVDSSIGLWDDTDDDPYVFVSLPVVRSAGTPASGSEEVQGFEVNSIDVTAGVLTFKIKAWIKTAPGGSTAADFSYLDFYYLIQGEMFDETDA